jgi:hypothetical protein
MISIITAARNDDYGGNFRERFFRAAEHNAALLADAGIPFEYMLAEWNPLPDRPLLSEEFMRRIPEGRAIVIPPEIHAAYGLNPAMPFYEMPAKNSAIRRAAGEKLIVTNADVMFGEEIVDFLAGHDLAPRTLYRAHRVDVDPSLSWSEIKKPENQLLAGEGVYPPPYYLGAGGDFCLATKKLWNELRGFDERIRFSTRGKDWQFFLSAAASGCEIEFIGNVYHLDHGGGRKNTPIDQLNSDTIHFGKLWDLEFGLPVLNPDAWGLEAIPSVKSSAQPQIETLDARSWSIPPDQNYQDRQLQEWLTWPVPEKDGLSALALHGLYSAYKQRRHLIFRPGSVRQCVFFSGMQRAAEEFSVQSFCNFELPDMPGFSIPTFHAEPVRLNPGDYILEETGGVFRLLEAGSDRMPDVLPHVNRVGTVEYDPLLAKRLLLAYMKMHHDGIRRIAIYGAGSHTQELLGWGMPDDFELVAFLKSDEGVGEKWGKPLFPINTVASLNIDAVLLSSSAFEPEMIVAARQNGVRCVIPLYSDWRPDILAPMEGTLK